jgi:hypothetical protein
VRQFRPSLLLLVGSFLALTAMQCTSSFAAFASGTPGIGNIYVRLIAPTKEEVAGSGIDVSLDAKRSCETLLKESVAPPRVCREPEEAQLEASPILRLLRRRILPASPDDGF